MIHTISYGDIVHFGVLGMKWGIRRYQNPDGTLTPAGRRRLDNLDAKWARKHSNRIYKQTYKKSKKEFQENLQVMSRTIPKRNRSGSMSMAYANNYNRILATIMNKNVGDIPSPSGRLVRFVAKRGDIGVHVALADVGYDMSKVRTGVYSSGKVAYKKNRVEIQ